MSAEGVHAPDHEKEVETGADQNQRSPEDKVDTAMIRRRIDTVAVRHGRGSTVEAGTG